MLSLPTLAGLASTVVFAASTLPMLVKAYRSRDLASYSLGNMTLANLGNAVHSVYVYSLPPGPIWLLHTFHLVSSALMLGWYLRYGLRQPAAQGTCTASTTPRSGSARRPGATPSPPSPAAHWPRRPPPPPARSRPCSPALATPRPGPRLSTWTLLWSASSRSTRTPLATPARQHRTPHPEAS